MAFSSLLAQCAVARLRSFTDPVSVSQNTLVDILSIAGPNGLVQAIQVRAAYFFCDSGVPGAPYSRRE